MRFKWQELWRLRSDSSFQKRSLWINKQRNWKNLVKNIARIKTLAKKTWFKSLLKTQIITSWRNIYWTVSSLFCILSTYWIQGKSNYSKLYERLDKIQLWGSIWNHSNNIWLNWRKPKINPNSSKFIKSWIWRN